MLGVMFRKNIILLSKYLILSQTYNMTTRIIITNLYSLNLFGQYHIKCTGVIIRIYDYDL